MITYTSLERKAYGMMTRPDGTDAPLFHYVAGPELTSEVWAPGPLAGTVWVLDPSANHGARVVNVRYSREVEYSAPALPGPSPVTEAEYDRAGAILAQMYASEQRTTWRGTENFARPERPAAELITWARKAFDDYRAYGRTLDFFRAGHAAPRPISDKRFRELTMPDVRADDAQLLLAS